MERRSRGARTVAAITAAAMLAACSSFDPYQRAERTDVPLRALSASSVAAGDEPLAGDLHGAILLAKEQRTQWYESLSAQSKLRAATQASLIAVTAVALYSGLKTGITSDSDKHRLALAGAFGFAAYTGSTWFINQNQENAYVDGVHALTCAMLTIEPLRVTEGEYKNLRRQRDALNAAVNRLDEALLVADATYRYPKERKHEPQALTRKEAAQARTRALKTLASMEQFLLAIEQSGVVMRRESDLVFARVAASINSSHKAIDRPDILAAGGTEIIGKFRAVKIDAGSEGAKDPSSSPPSEPDPAPAAEPDTPAPKEAAKPLSQATTQELLNQIARNSEAKARATVDAAKKKDAKKQAGKKQPETSAEPAPPSDEVAVRLAKATAEVYAKRRPLSNRLLAFHEARTAASRNAQCVAGASAMVVSPLDDAKVKPGDKYEIDVTGVTVAPTVTVNGPATAEVLVKGATHFVVRVQVAADATGTVTVAISDRGLAHEDISLSVEAPAKAASK